MTKLEKQLESGRPIFVSITGLRLKRPWHILLFLRYAVPSFNQARTAEGNLFAEVKNINGVRHTLTAWESKTFMMKFLHSGQHQKAILAFPRFATGKTLGYEADRLPRWDEVHQIWKDRGIEYSVSS